MVGGRETGNETYVVGLLDGLSTLAGDFEVCVYQSAGALQNGRPHLTSRRLASASPWIRLGLDLPVRSWRDHIDVLHMTYTAPLWTLCPTVVTVHDISFATNPEWFSDRDLRVLSRAVPWSMARAARVITVSDVCRLQIIEHFGVPPERVVRIYNGPGLAAEPIGVPEARALVTDLGVDPMRKYVLAVGNLQPRKNLVRLIEAFNAIAPKCPDVDLVIVGAKHYRAADVLTAGGEIGDRIRFTGYVTDRQLAACYELAALFAFPSLFEGFGLPAIEAMAHGVPVVCSRAGALPEVCADAAMYFDPLDAGSIADALLRGMSDEKLRQQLVDSGLRRSQAFSWRQSAAETLSAYESAARRGKQS